MDLVVAVASVVMGVAGGLTGFLAIIPVRRVAVGLPIAALPGVAARTG